MTSEQEPEDGVQNNENNPRSSSFREWHRLWLGVATLAALTITVVDAILIQRKHQIFTGGFLTIDHLEGVGEVVIFLLTSLIADFGVTFPLAAMALWLFTKTGLNAKPSMVAVFAVAITPIMAANYVDYRINVYLGQAFDFGLSYEIADGSMTEIFAVAAPHIVPVLLFLISVAGIVMLAIFLFKKQFGSWTGLPPAPPVGNILLKAGLVSGFAVVITCVAWASEDSLANSLRLKQSAERYASLGEAVTDIDNDGYGVLRWPGDPKPLDSSIYPYAEEIPGNGIDENDVAGDLTPDLAPYREASGEVGKWINKPDVILILLESYRNDLIGKTYKGKPITPVLNSLAEEGVFSSYVFSHSGFTAPSRYHLLVGSLAHLRGKTSLIDDFKKNGYEVAYFSAQDASFGGARFDIGFSRADIAYDARVEPHRRYTTFATPGSIALPYQVIVEKVTNFLQHRERDRPLFLYVNLQDTHFPYHHRFISTILSGTALARSSIAPKRSADLWSTYVNTAANVDEAIGKILQAAKQVLKEAKPGIIITSDSGESLYDDGTLGHGTVLNDNQTNVPLIVVNLPMVIEEPFGLVNLRDALREALAQVHEDATPSLRQDPSGVVFQYLGRLNRPREIALRSLSGQIAFDFRERLFQTLDGKWQRPDDLSATDKEAFQYLVQYWERMVIAEKTARNKNG